MKKRKTSHNPTNNNNKTSSKANGNYNSSKASAYGTKKPSPSPSKRRKLRQNDDSVVDSVGNVVNNNNPKSKNDKAVVATTNTSTTTLACVASPWGPIHTPVVSNVVQDVVLERFQKELVQRFPSWILQPHQQSLERRRRQQQGQERTQLPSVTKNNLNSRRNDNNPATTKAATQATNSSTQITTTHVNNNQQHDNNKSNLSNDQLRVQSILRSRILVGTNQCTRALEAAIQCSRKAAAGSCTIMDAVTGSTATMPNSSVVDSSAWCPPPSLIIMARDVYPPTMLAHIPVMAQQLTVGTKDSSVPIALLPRNASWELGKILRTNRRVAIVAFMPNPVLLSATTTSDKSTTTTSLSNDSNNDTTTATTLESSVHEAVDSFIEFVQNKIKASSSPPPSSVTAR